MAKRSDQPDARETVDPIGRALADALLQVAVADAAARTMCARWIVLRRGAELLTRNARLPVDLPPAPARLREILADKRPRGATETPLPLGSESDPLSFRLGTLLQLLLEWTVGEDGHPVRMGRSERRALGAFYTPEPLVRRVVDLASNAISSSSNAPAQPLRVCDPACGSGNFLVGAAHTLADARRVVSLEGVDVDPLATWAAEVALSSERRPGMNFHIRNGDALVGRLHGCRHDETLDLATGTPPTTWEHTFDLVIGNPPFLGQLSSSTVRSRALAEYLRHASDGVVSGYADAAAAFLWKSITLASHGGVIAMILPRSILASRDASRVRTFAERHAEILRIEPIDRTEFDAGVQPCIVVLRKREPAATPPSSLAGAGAWTISSAARTLDEGPTLDSICVATADFREAYYGLQPFLVEDADGILGDELFPRLLTCGLIDPGVSLWGKKRVRIYKKTWLRPRVDLARLRSSPQMAAWAARRLVPKVLVATQTRAIECVADERGEWLPLTPVITVTPRPNIPLERLLRALAAPAASSAAIELASGTGMSAHVIRLTARQIGQLPLSV